ncbi:MAG: rod shape-determining protein RodA [Candidatus Omnitrophica bacterium]|nr:rod shape-determining protein RodA [Candidatus Omnitrophota bacterium]
MRSHSLRATVVNLKGLKTVAICLLIFNALSLISIYSSLHQAGEFVGQQILYRQLLWIAVSWLALLIFANINYRIYFDLAHLIYGFNLLLLFWVLFFGKKVMGAQRWIEIFGFTFQPSELSKIATIIILAKFFSSRQESIHAFLLPLGFTAFNALVILIQPDLGTALIIVFLFLALGLFSRIPKRYFFGLIAIGLLISPFLIGSLKDYQKRRLLVFMNSDLDPLGAGYTIIQSKIAVGSGKFTGRGFLSGTQNQFNFLPERHTDFIFTVIAEEWGFFGSLFLIILYWLILSKVLQRAKETQDQFACFLCLGISLLFFLHIFINIGMTLGILPVVGLPLIFLSYGGSSLLVSFILLGIFFNISRSRK